MEWMRSQKKTKGCNYRCQRRFSEEEMIDLRSKEEWEFTRYIVMVGKRARCEMTENLEDMAWNKSGEAGSGQISHDHITDFHLYHENKRTSLGCSKQGGDMI